MSIKERGPLSLSFLPLTPSSTTTTLVYFSRAKLGAKTRLDAKSFGYDSQDVEKENKKSRLVSTFLRNDRVITLLQLIHVIPYGKMVRMVIFCDGNLTRGIRQSCKDV